MKGLFTLQEVVVLQAGQRIQKVAGRSARMRRFAGWKGALFGLMGLLLSACHPTEVKEIWEDRYVEQPTDTLEVIDNWFLDTPQRVMPEAWGADAWQPMNLCLADGELFVADKQGRQLVVLDARNLTFLRSFSHGGRTEAHDVYVQGDWVFVATGTRCEVQVFERSSGAYLTRLGTGSYQGNVSKNACVAASDRWVFVRDSKAQNIRVFDRRLLSPNLENHNEVFARLDTKGFFIDSAEEPLAQSYDMEIVGDSLYAFLDAKGVICAYSLDEVEHRKDETRCVKTTLPKGCRVYAAAPDRAKQTVWLSLERDGNRHLAEFTYVDFWHRRFTAPLRTFASNDRHRFPARPMVAFADEQLYVLGNNRLDRWNLVNKPTYIIVPR